MSSLSRYLVGAFVGAMLLLCGLTGPVHAASTLYAATGSGGIPSDLLILDANTGALITNVGPIGFSVTGLAFHPGSGVLYAVTSNNEPTGAGLLLTVDVATGGGTLIGGGNLGNHADIAFDGGGTLYGWSEGGGDDLVTIDLVTGLATVVGDFSMFTRGSGLTFGGDGTLWSAGQADSGIASLFHSIDPTTGASSGTVALSGAAFGRMGALATDDLGTIYATDGCTSGNPPCFQNLLTVDTGTGVVSVVGPTVTGLDALAFTPTEAVPVATKTGLAVMGLALLVALAALSLRMALRRRPVV